MKVGPREYTAYYADRVTYTEAHAACAKRGTTLANVQCEAELEALRSVLICSDVLWLLCINYYHQDYEC